MCHELLTQRALFCIGVKCKKKGTLSQHFVTHVVPPLGCPRLLEMSGANLNTKYSC